MMPTQIVKAGPCGGSGGTVKDMNVEGITRIVRISIRHAAAIDALTVRFLRNGHEESTEQWGGQGGVLSEIDLQPDEYITSVKGHFDTTMRSLKFETNLKTYGPYGQENGIPFELPASSGQIIGFHARSGQLIDALGVYVKGSTPVVTKKAGPCGGSGGTVREMNADGITRIIKISIRHAAAIDALTVRYLRYGHEESTEQWGGQGGQLSEFNLQPTEYITSVKGHFDSTLRSLKFETNLKIYGPYGQENGIPFVLPANDGQIIGFHVRSGRLIDALGVYIKVNNSGGSISGTGMPGTWTTSDTNFWDRPVSEA